MNCQFISGSNIEGSLADFKNETRDKGFLSFLRLVGTLYFKKHLASFTSIYRIETPDQLYYSTDGTSTVMERHKAFIEKIRNINSERITSEEDRMPSISALHRHWLRTTYICNLWSNAALGNVYASLPSPQDSGWILNGNDLYSIDWEDQDGQDFNLCTK